MEQTQNDLDPICIAQSCQRKLGESMEEMIRVVSNTAGKRHEEQGTTISENLGPESSERKNSCRERIISKVANCAAGARRTSCY